jgi:hypothetical protein
MPNTGRPGRMIGALHEGKTRDDLRHVVAFEGGPTTRPKRRRGHEADIAARGRNRRDHAGRAHVADERHREAEMERALSRIAAFAAEMSACTEKRCLHIGEGRNDDAPDALGGVERQDAAMALDQPASSCRPRARAGTAEPDSAVLLGGDQRIDDLAALHQQAMHRFIDAIDLAAQVGERGRSSLRHDAGF